MNSVYYKEHDDGIASHQVGSLSSGSGPWWSGLVTQSTFEDSLGRIKSSSMENCGEQFMPIAPKPSPRATDQKGNITHFNVFSGDSKNSSNAQKPLQFQAAFTIQSSPQEYGGHLELGFGQPAVICGKYPYGDQYYGMLSTYGPQIAGRVMLPMNLSSDDGPIFVNAKQYHGIIRRRRSRAKAEMARKVTKSPISAPVTPSPCKTQAKRLWGAVLNTKEMENVKVGKLDSKLTDHPTGSQRSEVLQSDHETNGSKIHMPVSEVTSMFSMGDLNHCPIGNLLGVSISDMMMSGNSIHGFGMHNKWVAAAGDNRCNLAV